MERARRIVALVGVILLVLLYVSTLIFAVLNSPLATALLKTSLLFTLVLPIIIYLITMATKNGTDLFEEVEPDQTTTEQK